MKKTLAVVLLAVLAVSALSLVTFAEAKSFMNWRWNDATNGNWNFGNHWWNSMRPTQQSFVRAVGFVEEWGTEEFNGTIQIQTRTITQNETTRQGTSVTAIWTDNGTRPSNSLRNPQNITYVFYTARLVNASHSILDFEIEGATHKLFINGTWNVNNITSTIIVKTNSNNEIINVNRNQNVAPLATNAKGNLTINEAGEIFALTIDDPDLAIDDVNGIDSIIGSISYQRITSRTFNLFKISEDDSTSTVTPADVASIVKSYGSAPGWGNYNQCMDYNFNYKIDITDLATAAANINQE